MDAAELIRQGDRNRATVHLCLDWQAQSELEEVARALEQARARVEDPSASMADGDGISKLEDELAEVRERAAAAVIPFELQALTRREWASLVADHQPSQDASTGAKMLGYDPETFFPALIRSSLVSPDLDEDTFDLLVDEKLTAGQYDQLVDACLELSKRKTSIPFSRAGSATTKS